jgi:arylsulfatase A-like enzyme
MAPLRWSASARHLHAGAVAGLAVGAADAWLAAARPGFGVLSERAALATVLLALVLHGVAGVALTPLAAGGLAVAARVLGWARGSLRRLALLAAAPTVITAAAALALWPRLALIEWDAVDWRLPLLLLAYAGVYAAWALPRRALGVLIAAGLVGLTGGAGLAGWSNLGDARGEALARLGEESASGRWLLQAARAPLDGDGDGVPTGLCTSCDCDDEDASVYPGAAEVAGNGRDEDCDGVDLDPARTAEFAALLAPAAAPVVRRARLAPALEPLAPGDPAPEPTPVQLPPNRPNLLFVVVDTLRADHLGLYGYERDTSPRLDELARDAVIFEQARATGSQTRFSVPPMITGRYFTELARSAGKWPALLEEEVTIAERLKAVGYRTAAFHSIAYLRSIYGFAQGFDHYDATCIKAREPARFRPTSDYVTDRTLAWVDETELRASADPWLLWVYYGDPHSPYIFHKDFPRFGGWMKDVYDNEVAFTDHHMGRLFDGLRERGLLDQTVVILTSDHGEGLDEEDDHGHRYHGPHLHEEVVRVPLLAWGPGLTPGRVDTPVSLIDLAPTFADLAGAPPAPDYFRGVSLVPWLIGDLERPHPPVFMEKHKDTARPQKAMVLWPYKVIVKMPYYRVKVFDLSEDPRERRDLAKTMPAEERERLVGLLGHWAKNVLEPRDPVERAEADDEADEPVEE